jgi:hypothetical protein
MARRQAQEPPYLEEKTIQQLERMGEQLPTFLTELGENLPKWFTRLMRSYRLAARVANASWRYIDAYYTDPNNVELFEALIEDLRSSLSDYAPAAFRQPPMELIHRFEDRAKLYDQACELETKEQILEMLYNAANQAASDANAAA